MFTNVHNNKINESVIANMKLKRCKFNYRPLKSETQFNDMLIVKGKFTHAIMLVISFQTDKRTLFYNLISIYIDGL